MSDVREIFLFYTKKHTRDERVPLARRSAARVNSFVGPPVPTARAPEAVRRRRRRPRRARAKSRAPRFRTRKSSNGAASETSSTALATPSASSASSPKTARHAQSHATSTACTHATAAATTSSRDEAPTSARATFRGGRRHPRRSRPTRRGARDEFDELSSPPSLLSPRVGFARGAGFEPRPEGRMRRVRMRRCHVSPPHERVHHRVRARRGVGQRVVRLEVRFRRLRDERVADGVVARLRGADGVV